MIHIRPSVMEMLEVYVQNKLSDPESGGILLGTVHGPHLDLVHATLPFPTDRKSRCRFERHPKGHTEVANQFWRESGGIIRYVGEWHTHPEDQPSPSSIDLREWKALAAKRADGRPMVGVIVGIRGIYIQSTSAAGENLVYEALASNRSTDD